LQANLRLRHRLLLEINRYMDEQGFTQIETPNLIKSTPEGARDYVVPRESSGKVLCAAAVASDLQTDCMIAGLDKYYQIARCFRDEDLRADRQPEFSQLDVEIELCYARSDLWAGRRALCPRLRLIDVDLPIPFPRLTFAKVMERFGSDKPDMRIEGMELKDLSIRAPKQHCANVVSASADERSLSSSLQCACLACPNQSAPSLSQT